MMTARQATHDNWRDRLGLDDPERCLLVAVIKFALRDLLFGAEHQARDAHAYLNGPNFAADCALLDVNPDHIHHLIQEHPAMAQRLLTREQIHQAHADYLAGRLTIEQVAANYTVSPATLSRYFAQENLPVRPRRPRLRRAASSNMDALHELNRVLVQLSHLPATGVIRLNVDIELTLNEENAS